MPFFSDDTGFIRIWTITFSGFASVYLFWLSIKVRAREAEAFARLERGIANPFKNNALFSGYRSSFLVVGIPVAIFLFFVDIDELLVPRTILSLFLVLSTITIYALTCDPLPPCSGRLCEKIRGFLYSENSADTDVSKHSGSRL